jgi:hypothetical protein
MFSKWEKRRITVDLEGLARLRVYPFSVDVCLVLQERLVVKL